MEVAMRLDDSFRSLRSVVMAAPPPPKGQPPVSDVDEFALRTYRYVRVLIVVLSVGLLAAVLLEGATADCLLGSISAYYYTPARGLFTGGLIGIGVCLIAIRGENDLQDGLLNVAGLFAPMVALVPMHLNVGTAAHPSREALCIINAHRVTDLRPGDIREAAFGLVTAGRVDSIRNNTWALLIMIGLGLLLLGWLIWRERRHPRAGASKPKWWPWAVSVLAAAGLWAVYLFAHGFYIEKVHFTTAILMFAAVSVFAVVDGIRTIWLQRARKRGITYVVLGVILLGGCGAIMLIGKPAGWDYTTFTAEVWGISVFLVFWVVQTFDLWNHTSRRTAILSAAPE
jgi:hypothetical protein